MTAPVLETTRLILRGPELTDFPAHAALWADPRMALLGSAQTREESWVNFQFNAGQWALMNIGCWALVEKSSKRYIGTAGFHYTNRTIDYEGRAAPEISWGIAVDFHGKGLAREAVSAALVWADAQLSDGHTWCLIQPENTASLAMAKDAGYLEAGRRDYRGKPMIVFARNRKLV
jgi:RimJ/RimL family protein N-acetyltransferase